MAPSPRPKARRPGKTHHTGRVIAAAVMIAPFVALGLGRDRDVELICIAMCIAVDHSQRFEIVRRVCGSLTGDGWEGGCYTG